MDAIRDQSQFLGSFSRLAGNWPGTPQETIESKAREFLRAFEEYGPDRFDRAVTALIDRNPYQFFPTLAEFRGYVPAPDWLEKRRLADEQTWGELARDRRAHPERYFGTADVVCMMRLFQMRAAKGRPSPTEDEVFATIAKVRERAGMA